jgi:hypothetical protein
MDVEEPGPAQRGLLERLDGGGVICAQGYLFELERRGYKVEDTPSGPRVLRVS